MFITGIADEAGVAIADQISAHQELGWSHLEVRGVQAGEFPAANLHDIPDAAFDLVERAVKEAGMDVYCFSSAIANWGKQIDQPFDDSLAEARRAVARMKRLGTKFIRIMSFAVRQPGEGQRAEEVDQMAPERFRRLREIFNIFTGEGLVPLHENCMNYGGMGWRYTQEMLAEVPGLRLVFDTGNPVFADDRGLPTPWPQPMPKQSAWEFYENVRDFVDYVHIKDGVWNAPENKTDFCFPGEGEGDVERIVADLAARGYDGGFSIEPHMAEIFHEPGSGKKSLSKREVYIEYGRRLEALTGKYFKA